MATRAQIVIRAMEQIRRGDLDTTPPWYARDETWDVLFQVMGMSSDLFRAFNQPLVACAIDTVSGVAQRQVLTKADAEV